MAGEIVECVPNFSEGINQDIVEAIAHSIASVPGTAVLDRTMDADHNRCVITFAGRRDSIVEAAVRGVGQAVRLIDLNSHSGVHPRVGAADVVPFVPVQGISLKECACLAVAAGEEIWKRFQVPVYLYEAAARREERKRLENVRREAASRNANSIPDIGGPQFHATAGAALVGARKFLIAWNVNLATTDLEIAKSIARSVRGSSGGLPCVKALGLPLASRNQVQVSMNLTDFEVTPMRTVYDAVEREALARGIEIADTELIGLIPEAALRSASPEYLRMENFTVDRILENRIAALARLSQVPRT